jgi:hypothetical protein
MISINQISSCQQVFYYSLVWTGYAWEGYARLGYAMLRWASLGLRDLEAVPNLLNLHYCSVIITTKVL